MTRLYGAVTLLAAANIDQLQVPCSLLTGGAVDGARRDNMAFA